MVQVVLTKYWVLAHLLVMAGTLCFCPTVPAFGGLWCAVSLVLMALCLPPVHKGESFWMARTRVWERMRGDVVFWGGLLAAGGVAVGRLNGRRRAL